MAVRDSAGGWRAAALAAPRTLFFDLAGLLLLLAAAVTPWTATARPGNRPELLTAVGLAAVGILASHLIQPTGPEARRTETVVAALRLLAGLPLLIGVAMVFVAPQTPANALGLGVVFAAGGAFMAIAPGIDLAEHRVVDAVRHGVAAASFLAAGALSTADALLLTSSSWENPILWAAGTPSLGVAASAWWLAWLVMSRDPRGPTVAVLFAAAWPLGALALTILDQFGAVIRVEGSLLAFGFGDIALATALSVGAILLHGPSAPHPERQDPAPTARGTGGPWLGVAAALQVLVAINGVSETMRMLILLTWNSVGMIMGTHVVAGALLGSTACLALSLISRGLLLRAPVAGRLVTLAANLGIVVLLAAGALLGMSTVGNGQAVALVALPVFTIGCLLIPSSVRRGLGPLLPRDGWHGLGLTHEPQYAGAPRAPLAAPATVPPEQLFADLDLRNGQR